MFAIVACDNSDKLPCSVADQLYSTKFRFIYELLQNADDAQYGEGVVPTLTFRISSDGLTVESNEEGFTVLNVRAICSTGESSKINESDSTGEKGFGFKSVFGIADKVNIQSGKFSFRFEHRRGQDGIGMVAPIWTHPVAGSDKEVGTRFTLRYARNDVSSLKALLGEFGKIPPTVVFALRRIQRFIIEVDDVLAQRYTVIFEKQVNSTNEISIFKADSRASNGLRYEMKFRTVFSVVSDMPETELRPDKSESKIVLAFPIDSIGSPRIDDRGQHVFAYLPVQRVTGISVRYSLRLKDHMLTGASSSSKQISYFLLVVRPYQRTNGTQPSETVLLKPFGMLSLSFVLKVVSCGINGCAICPHSTLKAFGSL